MRKCNPPFPYFPPELLLTNPSLHVHHQFNIYLYFFTHFYLSVSMISVRCQVGGGGGGGEVPVYSDNLISGFHNR